MFCVICSQQLKPSLTTRVPGAAGRAHTTLEGAGHFVQEERGAELADVVARFVEDAPRV